MTGESSDICRSEFAYYQHIATLKQILQKKIFFSKNKYIIGTHCYCKNTQDSTSVLRQSRVLPMSLNINKMTEVNKEKQLKIP